VVTRYIARAAHRRLPCVRWLARFIPFRRDDSRDPNAGAGAGAAAGGGASSNSAARSGENKAPNGSSNSDKSRSRSRGRSSGRRGALPTSSAAVLPQGLPLPPRSAKDVQTNLDSAGCAAQQQVGRVQREAQRVVAAAVGSKTPSGTRPKKQQGLRGWLSGSRKGQRGSAAGPSSRLPPVRCAAADIRHVLRIAFVIVNISRSVEQRSDRLCSSSAAGLARA
jgi:hypothetical protein